MRDYWLLLAEGHLTGGVCKHAAEDRGAAVADGIRRAQSAADFDDDVVAEGNVYAESSGDK